MKIWFIQGLRRCNNIICIMCPVELQRPAVSFWPTSRLASAQLWTFTLCDVTKEMPQKTDIVFCSCSFPASATVGLVEPVIYNKCVINGLCVVLTSNLQCCSHPDGSNKFFLSSTRTQANTYSVLGLAPTYHSNTQYCKRHYTEY